MQEVERQRAGYDIDEARRDFPVLKRLVHGKRLVYLDNAATTQKPIQVINAISDYYSNYNANIHRSVHQLAEEATEAFEGARKKVGKFVSSSHTEEIIFTRNATEALNLVAQSLSRQFLKTGDKIVVTVMEHHSNFVPWQQIAKWYGATLELVDVTDDGLINENDLEAKIKGAKIFSFAHMSNVLGTINDAKKLSRIGHDNGAFVVVDGAQSAPHIPVNVQEIGCDFFALSAHKMLGPTGVGCLYGKKQLLEVIPPFLLGGDMIRQVSREESTWNDVPWKFEAGTSNIAGVIGFGVAIDYLESIGMRNVMNHETDICRVALEELAKVPGLVIYGPKNAKERGAAISFNLGNIHAHDVASILDGEGIAIRSGHHCAQILMQKLGVPATSRASFYIYNGYDDIDALIRGLAKVEEVLA